MKFLEQKFCEQCGASIDVHYIIPTKIFKIEDGNLVRDDNNDAFKGGPFLVFLCSEDTTHEIGDNKELNEWFNEVEDKFYEEKKYDDL